MVRAKKSQQVAGAPSVVVEGAVEDADIVDAMCADILQPSGDGFYGETAYRFFSTADAKSTRVEAATGSLQLHKRFVPAEERALFGRHEAVEVRYSRRAVVLVGMRERVNIAQSRYLSPLLALCPHR